MDIALTGSSGFIGGHLKKLIEGLGHNVICIARANTEKLNTNKYTYEDLFLGKVKSQFDCMIHLASPNYDYAKDESLNTGIVELTREIITCLPLYGCKKFIFFSTAKVYGEPSLHADIFSENSKLNPISDYARAKVIAEEITRKMSSELDFKYLIYRMPLVYGSNMKSNIGKLLNIINSGYPFISFGKSKSLKKSFLCIENIKTIIKYNLINTDSIDNRVLNIADKNSIALDEVIANYKVITKSKSIIISVPNIIFQILMKIPVIKNILIKLYGNFVIDTKCINEISEINILDTFEGLSFLNNGEEKNE